MPLFTSKPPSRRVFPSAFARCAAAGEGCRVEAQSAKTDLGKPFCATRTPVSARTSQAWLRRFNSAFVSRSGFLSEECRMQSEEAGNYAPRVLSFCTLHSELCTFPAPVAQSPERDASNVEDEGESPSGSANSRACGSTRTAEGPDSESGSLGGASPFMPTISRRLASAGTADPGDLKPPSLPGASPGSPTGVWFTGNSRPLRLKIEQPWECNSPHADPFWNVNRTSGPGLFAKQRAPGNGSVAQVHGIPPFSRV